MEKSYQPAAAAGLHTLYRALAAMPTHVLSKGFFTTSVAMRGFQHRAHTPVTRDNVDTACLYAAACLVGLCQLKVVAPEVERSYFQLADSCICMGIQVRQHVT